MRLKRQLSKSTTAEGGHIACDKKNNSKFINFPLRKRTQEGR